MADLRGLPSIERLLQDPRAAALLLEFGRPLTLDGMRSVLDSARQDAKIDAPIPDIDEILNRVTDWLHAATQTTLLPLINATGVILHTNLGRAPLSTAAMEAVQRVAATYSSLEFNLETGKRGSREVHAEALLTQLTGAEAALVVNNNAAAVLLALSALAKRRSVVISRTQLVEIGGGFRVPEVMKQSGAHLVEVGTTNRVHLRDYVTALEESSPALVMHAHSSNFRLIGFTSEPALKSIIDAVHEHAVPFLDDNGSGALLDTAAFGLSHEPTVQESLAAGADLVCFSGDKLLGGPQAGILIGKAALIQKLKKHPLARAVRADKLCLAALSETLLHYLKDDAVEKIPVWQMISASPDDIRRRAQRWKNTLGFGRLMEGQSTVGGGSLPEETLPTTILALDGYQPNQLLARLRCNNPPVIARVEENCVVFDPRTVLPDQDEALLDSIISVTQRNKS
ncbi:MAG: L-seryl-tRNA(Sec) selenium transferase [Bellilinea sp.]